MKANTQKDPFVVIVRQQTPRKPSGFLYAGRAITIHEYATRTSSYNEDAAVTFRDGQTTGKSTEAYALLKAMCSAEECELFTINAAGAYVDDELTVAIWKYRYFIRFYEQKDKPVNATIIDIDLELDRADFGMRYGRLTMFCDVSPSLKGLLDSKIDQRQAKPVNTNTVACPEKIKAQKTLEQLKDAGDHVKRLYYLLKLSQEAVEVSKEVHKAVEFGLDTIHPELHVSNRDLIHAELNDLNAVIEVLNSDYGFGYVPNETAVQQKQDKMENFWEKSRALSMFTKKD